MYVIGSAWRTRLRYLVLAGAVAAVAFGWALGAGTGSVAAGLGFGAAVTLLFGGVVFLFHGKEIRGVPGAVVLRVDTDGVYLGNPPRLLSWPRVREVLVYELRRSVGDRSELRRQLAVRTDTGTEVVEDVLVRGPVRVPELRAAVHEHAPEVPVTDLGERTAPP